MATHNAICLVGAFHGRYQELITALKKSSESFQEFIAWARYVVQRVVDPGSTPRIACSRPMLVVDFLQNSFISDRLATFFVSQEPATFEPFLVPVNFGDQPYLPSAYPFRFKLPQSLPSDLPRPTLIDFLDKLGQTVDEMFAMPAHSLQRSLKIIKTVPLCPYGGFAHQQKADQYGYINRNIAVTIIADGDSHRLFTAFVTVEKARRKCTVWLILLVTMKSIVLS